MRYLFEYQPLLLRFIMIHNFIFTHQRNCHWWTVAWPLPLLVLPHTFSSDIFFHQYTLQHGEGEVKNVHRMSFLQWHHTTLCLLFLTYYFYFIERVQFSVPIYEGMRRQFMFLYLSALLCFKLLPYINSTLSTTSIKMLFTLLQGMVFHLRQHKQQCLEVGK